MSQRKLVFDSLKNIGSTKIPLRYNTGPETLVHMYVSHKFLPEEDRILLSYFLSDDYGIYANLLKKGTVLFEGLKMPIKEETGQKTYKMRYLDVPQNSSDSVVWFSNFNMNNLDISSISHIEKMQFENEKSTLMFPDLKASTEVQQQISDFLKDKPECTLEDYKKLAQMVNLDINGKNFENIFSEIINQTKIGNFNNVLSFISTEIFTSRRSLSEFYSSFILNVCLFKVLGSLGSEISLTKQTLEATNNLINKVSASYSNGVRDMKSQVLFQLFAYYTQIGDLDKAQEYLRIFIQQTQKLPPDRSFLKYIQSAAQSDHYNGYAGGLQNILPQYLSRELVQILLGKIKYYTELQFMLNFFDTYQPSLHKTCANEILESVFKIRDSQRSTYTRNTVYLKLIDILFRLQKRKVLEEDLSSDIKNRIFSYFISRNDYRDIYVHIKAFQIKDAEFLKSMVTQLEAQKYSNAAKQQLITFLKK